MKEQGTPAYLATLAEFASTASMPSFPQAVRDRIRALIADCAAATAAGMQEPEMQAWIPQYLKRVGEGPCSVIGGARHVPPREAAMLNGAAGTWLELDEGNLFAGGHPASQIFPAALAVAQDLGSTGAELLIAVALGYELSARINRAAVIHKAVHPHGTFGTIGAAIAVARLKKFDPVLMARIINCAATTGLATSFNTVVEGATVRNVYSGHAGVMGILVSELVECGFTGEADGVSEIYGRVISSGFDRSRVVENLGSEWLILQSYTKLHPTGHYVHSAIDALEDLLLKVPGQRLDLTAIESMDVRGYERATRLSEKNVRSTFGARFSIPFALATILHHGKSGLVPFQEKAIATAEIQALAQRVSLREDVAFTARYPLEQPIILTIRMRDGTEHEGRCLVTRGEPANPHTAQELRDKFLELGAPVWGLSAARDLHEEFMHIEDVHNVRAFSANLSTNPMTLNSTLQEGTAP
ncbi:MAG: MmgE/PrpD family protein [Burkholderiaceae bacterium]|nr:MmgE/PrpD family protein [Burkholderiaceae bacterium]